MSTVVKCHTCGGLSKINKVDGNTTYQAIQNEEAFKKIGQLKKAMEKYKAEAESLRKELDRIKIQ